ncbi:MAG: hypothetical protein JXQ71_16395 [Verrucomicrobia bacterium]|nr:hypothetical protein [Verrucomicrobiota bacterium]
MSAEPSVRPAPPGPRYPLWVCVGVNLLAFPGLGTVLARRRVGYAQAAVMVTGFLMGMGCFVWFLAAVLALLQTGDEEAWRQHVRSGGAVGLAGVALCAVAWLWALASSIRLWREGRRAQAAAKDGA